MKANLRQSQTIHNLVEYFLEPLPCQPIYHLARNIPLDVALGDAIRKLRIEAGLFQKGLANGIRAGQTTVASREKSRNDLTLETFCRFIDSDKDELERGW